MEKSSLVFGIIITIISLHYWWTIGGSGPISQVPIIYRLTFRLFPYMDIIITAAGIYLVIKGIRDIMKSR